MAENDCAISAWAPALAMAAFGTFISLALAIAPRDPHRLMAVFPPWMSQRETVHAALEAGDLIGIGGLPYFMLVASPRPDLEARLRASGALFVIDGDTPLFCSQSSGRQNAL